MHYALDITEPKELIPESLFVRVMFLDITGKPLPW